MKEPALLGRARVSVWVLCAMDARQAAALGSLNNNKKITAPARVSTSSRPHTLVAARQAAALGSLTSHGPPQESVLVHGHIHKQLVAQGLVH